MIPVIVESRKYKFIKKGKTLNHELVSLFNYIAREKKGELLKSWSEQMSQYMEGSESEEKKETVFGDFLKAEL